MRKFLNVEIERHSTNPITLYKSPKHVVVGPYHVSKNVMKTSVEFLYPLKTSENLTIF